MKKPVKAENSKSDPELRNRVRELEQSLNERLEFENSLKREKDFSSAVLDTVDALVVVLDKAGRIVRFNRACERATGYSFQEVKGRFVWDILLTQEEIEPVKGVFANLVSGMFPNRFENYWVARDGRLLLISWSNTALLDEKGEVEYVVPTGIEITGLRRIEEEKANLQRQLMQASKLESVGRLAGGIAHDFNNLLSAVIGYSEIALDVNDPGQMKEYLGIIREAGERAANLVRHLLAFSSSQVLEMKIVNLNIITENLAKMLSRLIGEDIVLKLNTPNPVRNVLADPGQMEQILMNLVVNSRDAMPCGGRLVIETADVDLDEEYTRTHQGAKPGPYVMLSVSDTGVGMSREVQEKIFEPFFTTKDFGKGSGLGLAIVYGIIKQHGGNIWVYSEQGKGTTIKIYVPAVADKLPETAVQESSFLPGGTETVLIVDDEPYIRKLAEDVLIPLGYRTMTASCGAEAVQVSEVTAGKIDLLLTDVIMPGMDGRELADILQSKRPGLKVLFMSGYTQNIMADRELLEPDAYFIQKPLSVSGLAVRIRELLDKK